MSSDPSGPEKREFAFFSEHLRILISHSNESHGQDISEQEFLSFWENPLGRNQEVRALPWEKLQIISWIPNHLFQFVSYFKNLEENEIPICNKH